MRDVLYEESIIPKNLKLQKTVYIIYTVFEVICIIIAAISLFFMLYFSWSFLIFVIFFALSATLFGFVKRKIYYCVDCTFVTGSTRLVKVVNFKRRKKLLIFEANEVQKIGVFGSDSSQKIYLDKSVKKIYATPNKSAEQLFYIFVYQSGLKYMVIMDCTQNYIDNLTAFTGKQIIEKD